MRCYCPGLMSIQARLPTLMSSILLLNFLFWILCSARLTQAAESDSDCAVLSRDGEDHNWYRIQNAGDHCDELVTDSAGNPIEDRLESKRSSVSTAAYQFQGNNIATAQDAPAGRLGKWQYPNRFLMLANATDGTGLPRYSEDGIVQKDDLEHHELRKREESTGRSAESLQNRQDNSTAKTIFVSGNTCVQPHWVGPGVQTEDPPQLTLYVSTVSENQDLGPDGDPDSQLVYPFVKGFVNASVPNASGDWFVAIYAPEMNSNFTGMWNYRLAMSLNDYFYRADTSVSFLNFLDADLHSALLMTSNLTDATKNQSSELFQQWMDLKPPFILFALNSNVTSYMGIENSFCGLQNAVQAGKQVQASTEDLGGNSTGVQMHMISRGTGHHPKQQFYVDHLNASSKYTAFLAMDGNSTDSGDGVVGGGGKVWPAMNFSTKSDGNCQLMFDLPFCEELAYAVPANPYNENATLASLDGLRAFYDNYTSFWYENFRNSLQVIACNTTSNAQYTVASNCNDCKRAYKEWLCAVSIPRCEDFSNDANFLQIRNVGQPFINNNSMLSDSILLQSYPPMPNAPRIQGSVAFQQTYISSLATNSSRNLDIDTYIKPGPYKETKPCEDLCYNLMQSCPAALGFSCPYPGRGLEVSYGRPGREGTVQCNFLGAYHSNTNSAARLADATPVALTVAVALSLQIVFL